MLNYCCNETFVTFLFFEILTETTPLETFHLHLQNNFTMSSECTHDCSSCSQNCSDRKEKQDFSAPQNPKSNVKRVIAVASGKGGVGKSSVTAMLASLARAKGFNVAILDADITGPSIPTAYGVNTEITGQEHELNPAVSKGGIKLMSINLLLEDPSAPVIWRGPVIAGVVKQFWSDVAWGDIDIMFVDMPPGTGDVPLTVFQSLHVDGVVIVTSPQQLVGLIAQKTVNMAEIMNIPVLGIVENMSYFECAKCGEKAYIYGESKVDEIAENHGIEAIAKLPINPSYAATIDAGKADELIIPELQTILDKIK